MRVIILAKAPVPGKVKTRLMTKFTAEQAAQLHEEMVIKTLSKVCDVFEDVWLAVDDQEHPFFKGVCKRFSPLLCSQAQGGLGERLKGLMVASFAKDDSPVMFLGTDSPHVSHQRYKEATQALQSHDVVIGAVEDGGYDLIALKKPYSKLFAGIDWGSDSVFRETMYVINHLELSAYVLSTSFDLDRPEDLERAPSDSW
ncbi:MAG: TIGR04282 family arsenosugar biosynthesis glycosyltransferase [Ghiorsea sp.]